MPARSRGLRWCWLETATRRRSAWEWRLRWGRPSVRPTRDDTASWRAPSGSPLDQSECSLPRCSLATSSPVECSAENNTDNRTAKPDIITCPRSATTDGRVLFWVTTYVGWFVYPSVSLSLKIVRFNSCRDLNVPQLSLYISSLHVLRWK